MNPLLSIIIATKNRVPYCISAIESILNIESQDIELVIQDNTDNFELKEYVETHFSDERLIYRYTPPPFSSIDNFNTALELATGEYVCMIGDDDGINPEIIEVTKWAKINKIEAVSGSLSANYRWLGTGAKNTLFTDLTGATLTIDQFSGKVKIINPESSLKDLTKNGLTNYLILDFPKFYHGVVKKSCFEKIKRQTGYFIGGLSPDIYSAVALSCIIEKAVIIDYPLTIPGVCGKSSSAIEGELKNHSLKIKDAPHFKHRGSYIWSEKVPPIYCSQTIWADSAMHAIVDMNRFELLKNVSFPRLYAQIFILGQPFSTELLRYIYKKNNEKFGLTLLDAFKMTFSYFTSPTCYFFLKKYVRRVLIILKLRQLKVYKNINNIVDATEVLRNHLKKRNVLFRLTNFKIK